MRPSHLLIPLVFVVATSQAQLGGFVLLKQNEVTPGVFLKRLASAQFGTYTSQWNPLVATVVPRDPYNDDETSLSILGVFTVPILFVYGMSLGEGRDGLDSVSLPVRIAIAIVVYPILISNSQHHFSIIPIDTTAVERISSSVFVGMQTDLFAQLNNKIDWARFTPSIGIDFLFPFNQKQSTLSWKKLSGPSIGVQVGFDKHWDISGQFKVEAPWRIFAGLKVAFL